MLEEASGFGTGGGGGGDWYLTTTFFGGGFGMNLGGGSKGGVGGIRSLAPIGKAVLAIIWQKLSNKWSAKKPLFSPGFFMIHFLQVVQMLHRFRNELGFLQSKMHREIYGKKIILA